MSAIAERIQARIVQKEAQLVAANTALNDILESQLENYDLENMETRQKAQNLRINQLQSLISKLESDIEKEYSKLNGEVHCSYMRLRR